MGTLARFRFSDELVKRYPIFIETGTRYGAGVRFAKDAAFERIYSIDVDPKTGAYAEDRLASDDRFRFVTADSRDGIRQVLAELGPEPPGIVFWLDAHFGEPRIAEMAGFDWAGRPDLCLPLEDELEIIKFSCPNAVVLIDDLRLYMDGPFYSGSVPCESVGLTVEEQRQAILRIYAALAATHDYRTLYSDEGYLIIVPRGEVGPEFINWDFAEYIDVARKYLEVGDEFAARGAYYR